MTVSLKPAQLDLGWLLSLIYAKLHLLANFKV